MSLRNSASLRRSGRARPPAGIGDVPAAGNVAARRPGRGSGSVPSNRPRERMSTTCAASAPLCQSHLCRAAHHPGAQDSVECLRAAPARGHRLRWHHRPPPTPRGRHRAAKRRRDRTCAEHPPHPRRAEVRPRCVIHHDMVAAGRYAKPRDHVGELCRGGNVCGNGDEASLASSMLNNCAPGMWPSRKSRRGSRFMAERYHDASRTRTRGSCRCSQKPAGGYDCWGRHGGKLVPRTVTPAPASTLTA